MLCRHPLRCVLAKQVGDLLPTDLLHQVDACVTQKVEATVSHACSGAGVLKGFIYRVKSPPLRPEPDQPLVLSRHKCKTVWVDTRVITSLGHALHCKCPRLFPCLPAAGDWVGSRRPLMP